jgi:hypothetical protein
LFTLVVAIVLLIPMLIPRAYALCDVPGLSNCSSGNALPNVTTTIGDPSVGVTAAVTTTTLTSVTVGTYIANPGGPTPFNTPTFYDVRVNSAAGITQVVVTFFYPSTVADPSLFWWNEAINEWVPICCNPIIDTTTHTITITLSASSSPTIRQLVGTAFGIGSPQVILEYPFGLALLAVFMAVGYGLIRRKAKP